MKDWRNNKDILAALGLVLILFGIVMAMMAAKSLAQGLLFFVAVGVILAGAGAYIAGTLVTLYLVRFRLMRVNRTRTFDLREDKECQD